MNIPTQRRIREALKDEPKGRWVHLNAVAYDRALAAWRAALAGIPRREDLVEETTDEETDATGGE